MLTDAERVRGRRLGAVLREARGTRPLAEVAAAAGVPVDTLRKIEAGRIPTPAFFTVAAIAAAVGRSVDDVAASCWESQLQPGRARTA